MKGVKKLLSGPISDIPLPNMAHHVAPADRSEDDGTVR
jgi:hypothetical protein